MQILQFVEEDEVIWLPNFQSNQPIRRTLKLLTKLAVIRCHMTKVERSL